MFKGAFSVLKLCVLLIRRQDSSIGFGAPVRANMRMGGVTSAAVTSSLLESVRTKAVWICWHLPLSLYIDFIYFTCCKLYQCILLYFRDDTSFPLNKIVRIPLKIHLNVVFGALQVESSDLIAYGLIPEFIGRFPILVSLSALTEDQLVQVSIHCLFIAVHLNATSKR